MINRAPLSRYALAVAAVLLYFAALVCVLLPMLCRSEQYLSEGFIRHSDRIVTGLDEGGEQRAAAALAKYFSDPYRDTPQVSLAIRDTPRDAFSEKELSHLKDIKQLLRIADRLAVLSFSVLLLALVCVLMQGRRELIQALHRAFLVLPMLLTALAVWAICDFDGLFITFHKLLFTNDNWLLDPRSDLLLQLMPLSFFTAALGRVALVLVPLILIPYVALRVLSARMLRKGGKV